MSDLAAGGDQPPPDKLNRALFQGSRAAEMAQRVQQGLGRPRTERGDSPPVAEPRVVTDYADVKGDLQSRLLEQLSDRDLLGASEDRIGAFVQEFADWCPYCVMMHPFVNNLSWVMEPVKNVRVGKIDQSANDTSGGMAAYLKTEGP